MKKKKTTYELYQLGLNLLETGDPAQAANVLERAKVMEPNKGSICEALGRAYYNFGQFDQAMLNFNKALEIDPTNHYAHFGLSLCLERKGILVKSYGHIKLALAMQPDLEDYKKVLARLERKLGKKIEG